MWIWLSYVGVKPRECVVWNLHLCRLLSGREGTVDFGRFPTSKDDTITRPSYDQIWNMNMSHMSIWHDLYSRMFLLRCSCDRIQYLVVWMAGEVNEQLLRDKVFAFWDLSPTCPGTGWDIRIDIPWRVCTLKHIATNTLTRTNVT